MKILFYRWDSFGNEDMIDAFLALGHSVEILAFSRQELRQNPQIEKQLETELQTYQPDLVFTFNYYPILSLVCNCRNIKYISWVYDSPYVLLYSYTIMNPCNLVFVFDKGVVEQFRSAGITTIYYLPLAANASRLSQLSKPAIQNNSKKTSSTIAFVGSLYTEKHQFFHRMKPLPERTKGYLEGIMLSQMKVYGYNFIQNLLTPDIIRDLQKALPLQPDPTGVETIEWLYAHYVINREITAKERFDLLSAIGKKYSLDLYTPDQTIHIPGCIHHGTANYYTEAPLVYQTAKINLNITLRSILSGIPLRAFEIMGAGGFLLTNYQADFEDCYIAGEDYVYYESKNDMMEKLEYYLSHEKERSEIAQNGFQRTLQHHSFLQRAEEMLSFIS